jgi:ornithine cyclodeaminase/alanine dehydrogenase-like protein (mu-crystallin family)
MDEMIDRLRTAIVSFDESKTRVRTRDGFHYTEPDLGLLEWMPVIQAGEATTIKVVGYHPNNPSAYNLPTILSTISVYETGSGHLAALADGTFLTALRTGAASAVASGVLARPDSHILGLVGCGAQSITQMHAIMRSFPIDQVCITDASPTNVATFETRATDVIPDGVEVRVMPVEALMQSADIVCTSTSVGIGEGPLFDDLPTNPWLHINAVGSDFPGKVELPAAMLRRGLVCPDVREQAVKEGECQLLAAEEIGPSLAHVVAHPDAYRSWQDRLTIFDSTGWALGDQVAMQMLLEQAAHAGVGTRIALEDISEDPLDPYDLGRASALRSASAPVEAPLGSQRGSM